MDTESKTFLYVIVGFLGGIWVANQYFNDDVVSLLIGAAIAYVGYKLATS